MSTEAKHGMLKEISNDLLEKMTPGYTAAVMEVISDKIVRYDVEIIEPMEYENEKEEFLEAFIVAKRIEGRSDKTIARYSYIIGKFLDTCSVGPRGVTTYHIRRYLMYKKDHGNSDRTVEGYRAVLNSFFGWLTKEGLIHENPVANISPITCQKKVRTPFSDVDLYKIIEQCDIDSGDRCTCDRNKTIVSFLGSTGCRISEMCALDRDSVHLDEMECVVHGKGNKDRVVYIDDVTAMLLKRYLDSRTDDSPALFVGKGSSRLTPGGVRYMLKMIEARSGVENVHPHRFRRTLATNLIGHGMPIQEVSRLLGHEKLDTTMMYCYVDQKSIKSSYQRYL